VQIIKVDRAFLAGVPHEPQATAVYSAILQLADACGCDVVAEGVEDPEHADFLVAKGCRIAQGYHFSRPVPAPEMTALLERRIAPERRRQRGSSATLLRRPWPFPSRSSRIRAPASGERSTRSPRRR
jgi:predicted signal transduction protein with EAL and GGDEF domain